MTLDATIATTRPAPGTAVVAIDGHLDVYSAPDVRTTLIALTNEARYRQVVDLTAVTFVDSTGLAVIVGAAKRAVAHGGRLALVVDLEGRTGKVLRITGVHKAIPHAPTVEEALELLAPKPPEPVASEPDQRPTFWPPQLGDVWLSGIEDGLIAPKTWVCYKLGQLCGVHDWDAEQVYRDHGPLRLVWRDGAVVTAMHSSELAR